MYFIDTNVQSLNNYSGWSGPPAHASALITDTILPVRALHYPDERIRPDNAMFIYLPWPATCYNAYVASYLTIYCNSSTSCTSSSF